jgi:hypothetical protein
MGKWKTLNGELIIEKERVKQSGKKVRRLRHMALQITRIKNRLMGKSVKSATLWHDPYLATKQRRLSREWNMSNADLFNN